MYECSAKLPEALLNQTDSAYGPGEYGPGSGGSYGPGGGGSYGPGGGGGTPGMYLLAWCSTWNRMRSQSSPSSQLTATSCTATEKKECIRPCMWCTPSFGGAPMCTDEMEARFLPAAVYDCQKGEKDKKKKKHDDDDDDKKKKHDKKHHGGKKHHGKKNDALSTMFDAVKHLFGFETTDGDLPFTCGTAFSKDDCEKGCYWYVCMVLVCCSCAKQSCNEHVFLNRCTMPYGPMGQCVGKDQKALMPGATCVKAHHKKVEDVEDA